MKIQTSGFMLRRKFSLQGELFVKPQLEKVIFANVRVI